MAERPARARAPLPEPVFFASAAELRRWFARHAASATELHVGFVKQHTGRAGLSWPQSVDEALCVGWIDGVRQRIDDEHYRIRFTPRKRGSHWSDVNIRRVAELEAEGRMQPAGLAAFQARTEARSRQAAYEQRRELALAPAELKSFRRNATAWKFFATTPPSYRHRETWRIVSAKRPETRARRLALLIAACAEGRRL